MAIPKMLHFVWCPDLQDVPEDRIKNPDEWQRINPEYRVREWDDEQIRPLIKEVEPQFLDIYDRLDMPVKKSDLARLFIMYRHGGVYLDYDLVPKAPLSSLLEAKAIYNKNVKMVRKVPDIPSVDFEDVSQYKSIWSREHANIDPSGVGLANGIILSEPEQKWIMDFVWEQKNAFNARVLDYVGVWALTRYVRARVEKLKKEDKILILPPHYFLWHTGYFGIKHPFYTISTHAAVNTWGDPEKGERFFDV